VDFAAAEGLAEGVTSGRIEGFVRLEGRRRVIEV